MITEGMLDSLRESIRNAEMSQKRRAHTLAVEEMAARIGAIYAPDKLSILRAAALLHDITKEYSLERQVEICSRFGHEPTDTELCAPKNFHAQTAAMLIPTLYPEFAEPEVIAAVRWHTTGRAGMTLTEKIVYLSDYIDDTRKFDDCVRLRQVFWSAAPQKMDACARREHLDNTLIVSYRMTITDLLENGCPIVPDTVASMNELICSKALKTEKNRKI